MTTIDVEEGKTTIFKEIDDLVDLEEMYGQRFITSCRKDMYDDNFNRITTKLYINNLDKDQVIAILGNKQESTLRQNIPNWEDFNKNPLFLYMLQKIETREMSSMDFRKTDLYKQFLEKYWEYERERLGELWKGNKPIILSGNT